MAHPRNARSHGIEPLVADQHPVSQITRRSAVERAPSERWRFGVVLLAAGVLAFAYVADTSAQTAPKPTPAPVTPPAGGTTEDPTPPTDPSTTGADPEKPLTEKLKEGEGILEPPRGIDPAIEKQAPVPEPGTTPVIPPPGEPGGAQGVQPK